MCYKPCQRSGWPRRPPFLPASARPSRSVHRLPHSHSNWPMRRRGESTAWPIGAVIQQNRFYRPQRSWAKVMFLQASVILSTGGGGVHAGQCMLGYHPPPREQTPLGADTPQEQTPPPEADSGIRSTSGRYASYWNAFLFVKFSKFCEVTGTLFWVASVLDFKVRLERLFSMCFACACTSLGKASILTL